MPTKKASAPEVQLRGRQCEQSDGDQTRGPAHGVIMHHSSANANVYTRSCARNRVVPALALALIVFAVCYLAGHVAAAIFGAYWLVYVGVGVGLWLIACAFICAFVGAASDG